MKSMFTAGSFRSGVGFAPVPRGCGTPGHALGCKCKRGPSPAVRFMNWPTRPPVVNERELIPKGLYDTFTVGYYMGGPRRVPLAEPADETSGGHYARPGCACKILGAAKCPVHGKHTGDAGCPVCRSFGSRMGQGCAVPSDVVAGSGSYQGGDVAAGNDTLSSGLLIGLGGAALVGGLYAVGLL